MRHRRVGKRLNRTMPHRRAMRRNLATSLFEHGAVRTTPAKAKQVRAFVERLISIARRGTLHSRRQVIALLGDRHMVDKESPDELLEQTVVRKLMDEIAPRYANRQGGYTRIIHLPERRIGDGGRQVLLQLVEEEAPERPGAAAGAGSGRRRRAARRAELARSTAEDEQEAAEQPPEEDQQAQQEQATDEPEGQPEK